MVITKKRRFNSTWKTALKRVSSKHTASIQSFIDECLVDMDENGMTLAESFHTDSKVHHFQAPDGLNAWYISKRNHYDNGEMYLICCYGAGWVDFEYRSWQYGNKKMPNEKELVRIKEDFKEIRAKKPQIY